MLVPMEVHIALDSPIVIGEHPMHLDALLAGILVRAAEDRGEKDAWLAGERLPLDRYVSPGGDWVWKASLLTPATRLSESFPVTMTGRINVQRAAEDRESGLLKLRMAKPNTAGGPFKGSIFSVTAQWVDSLVAYAIGDIEEVQTILRALEFVGPRRSQCFGRVRAVQVRASPDMNLAWVHRALPIDSDIPLPGNRSCAIGNLRAPYWYRPTQQPVLMPVDF